VPGPARKIAVTQGQPLSGFGDYAPSVQIYAITSAQIPDETLDLFLTRGAAEAELAEILEDEPRWASILSVVPIELYERDVSAI